MKYFEIEFKIEGAGECLQDARDILAAMAGEAGFETFEDTDNEKLVFDPRFAYVIPAGKEKIVKVALVGPTIIDEWKNADRSMEIQGYKKVGVGIVSSPNYWGIYYNSGIDAWGHGNVIGG